MKNTELALSLESMARQMRFGCGNHGCRINPTKGQATNTICDCLSVSRQARRLMNLIAVIEDDGIEVSPPTEK